MNELETWRRSLLRSLPAVHLVLGCPEADPLKARCSDEVVTELVGETLNHLRRSILTASSPEEFEGIDLSPVALAGRAAERLEQRSRPRLRGVINATGVVLHTNLGRAPLARAAYEQLAAVSEGYSNLELDLNTGERGSRYSHVQDLICRLTGAEAAMVVNNNAGAVLLVLAALASGREVVVSRGELVEIGGSFRVPEVMSQGGAILREVGTTNKTHLFDYERAIGPATAALMKVHTSNFKITGFTGSVSRTDLVALGRRFGLPVIEDLGSGVLLPLEGLGLQHEPTVQESLAAGIDLVTFSGDKLLGGPQGGILAGRRDLVEACRRHPLTRALRIDKLTLAALEATLRIYLDPARALAEIPTLRMLSLTLEDLKARAGALIAAIESLVADRAAVEVIEGTSQAGGGSLPGLEIPTFLVAVSPKSKSLAAVEAGLRAGDPPVLARIQKDLLLFDPRTLSQAEYSLVGAALDQAL